MTTRQQAIKNCLDRRMSVREIATELGVTRNAIYLQIQKMRRRGDLPDGYTPTGVPPRELTRLYIEAPAPGGGELTVPLELLKQTKSQLDAISDWLAVCIAQARFPD